MFSKEEYLQRIDRRNDLLDMDERSPREERELTYLMLDQRLIVNEWYLERWISEGD